MPSCATPRQLGAGLLSLPPSIRASLYQNAFPRRHFSASTLRQSTWTDLAVAGPNAALDAVHALGIPWYAAIPITAVLIRGTFGYYVTALPARRREITRRHLYPLSYARSKVQETATDDWWFGWMARHKENRLFPQRLAGLSHFLATRFVHIRTSHRTGKEFGAPMFSWRSFFNFGMMITFAEALRIKCGSREGLLSLLLGSTQTVKDAAIQRTKDIGDMSPDEILAHRIEVARATQRAKQEVTSQQIKGASAAEQDNFPKDSQSSPDAFAEVTHTAPSADAHLASFDPKAYSEFLDPTLQTEGIAWMQDLTVPDTTFMLPFALGALLTANVLLRPAKKANETNDASAESGRPKASLIAETSVTPPSPRNADANDVATALTFAEKLRSDAEIKRPAIKGPLANLTLGQKLGLTMSLLFFIVSAKLPAAILLYIIPTIATGFVQRRWLDLRHPLPEPIMPCRRSLRTKVRRTFADI